MSQILDLGKIRFQFKGDWSASVEYQFNDVVTYKGVAYVYISTAKTTGTLTSNTQFWGKMTSGVDFAGVWSGATTYGQGSLVRYGANLYVYSNSVASSGNLPTNTTYWTLYAPGWSYLGVWSSSTNYKIGEVVKYGGNTYIAVQDNVAQNPDNNTANWTSAIEGIQFEGVYNNATNYQKNDLVTYGGNTYIALSNTVGNIPSNTTYWNLFASGFKFESTWSSATAYQPGDVVSYGGIVYIANTESTNQNPDNNTTYWSTFAPGFQVEGTYNNATSYEKNDLVNYGSNTYIALTNTTGNLPTNSTYWSLFVGGWNYQGTWNTTTQYTIGQAVSYGGIVYVAAQDSLNQNPDNNTAYWTTVAPGFQFEDSYNNTTAYQKNDVVNYGGSTYIAKSNTTGNIPTNTTYWNLFSPGIKYLGTWSPATTYRPGDLVKLGGNLYSAVIEHSNQNPDNNTTYWTTVLEGFQYEANYLAATDYQKNDLVKYGGNLYIAKTNTQGNLPTNSTYWDSLVPGFNFENIYSAGTSYQPNDVVKYNNSLYISTSNTTGNLPTNTAYWQQFITNDSLQSINTYYVAPHGSDTNDGSTIAAAFATIRKACDTAGISGNPSTIFVKTGTYSEVLPIVVPPNVAIVGDNQRTTIVQPAAGQNFLNTGVNNQTTMFLLSNGSILNKMTFIGLTGWVVGAIPGDVTTSTPKGVIAAFNPGSPITTKSPYIIECSAIGSGLIGALVDGSVHNTGAKSMIFHGYTIISDNGIGYWVKDAGKAEIVSCFTYYCYFGYVSTGGGHIRALNGNNSYGTWGAVSSGYDVNETAVTGTLLGQQLNFTYTGGTINIGDTVTSSSGATGIVTNVQYTADKVYVRNTSGTFSVGNTLTFTSGGTGTVKTGALEDQKGFILILNGLTAAPKPGQSIQIAGDNFAYVVQSTAGTYVNTSSEIIVILAQEKPTGSASGSAVTLRSKYSQIRLTGHDFLSIGTGGVTTTNYPNTPTQPAAQGNETNEVFPGRVFYVSTDQDGNFRVGEYFRIDQATGRATLNASAFDLAGLTSLRLGSIGAQLGETINEFSSDSTLSGNSNVAVPTEYAVKAYVDNQISGVTGGSGGLGTKVSKSGDTMTGALTLSGAPTQDLHAATKLYVDTADNTILATTNIYKFNDFGTTISNNLVIEQDAVAYFSSSLTVSQNCQVDGILMTIDITAGDTLQTLTASPTIDTTLTGSFVSTKQQYSIPAWVTITVGATSTVNIIDIPRTYLF
jgi:hypothetical protein